MQLLRWSNPGHNTTGASSMVRGAGCREPNPRIPRREKNVLDMPSYRSGDYTQNQVNECNGDFATVIVPCVGSSHRVNAASFIGHRTGISAGRSFENAQQPTQHYLH